MVGMAHVSTLNSYITYPRSEGLLSSEFSYTGRNSLVKTSSRRNREHNLTLTPPRKFGRPAMSSPSTPHRRRSNESVRIQKTLYYATRGPNRLFQATLALVIVAMYGLTSPSSGSAQTGITDPIWLTNAHRGEDQWPSWSPDGTRIAFSSARDLSPLGKLYRNGEIYVMNADGSNPVRLTHNSDWDRDPAWYTHSFSGWRRQRPWHWQPRHLGHECRRQQSPSVDTTREPRIQLPPRMVAWWHAYRFYLPLRHLRHEC